MVTVWKVYGKDWLDIDGADFCNVVEIMIKRGGPGEGLNFLYFDEESDKRQPMIIHPRNMHQVVQSNFRGRGSIYLIVKLMEIITGHKFIEIENERFCRDDTDEAKEKVLDNSV